MNDFQGQHFQRLNTFQVKCSYLKAFLNSVNGKMNSKIYHIQVAVIDLCTLFHFGLHAEYVSGRHFLSDTWICVMCC